MFVAPPGYQPVYNPSIPYVGPIYGGLRSGMSVYIQGVIPHHITRFFINLQCGEAEGSDIAFHFNPRFDGWDKVVFNSCQGGKWGSEEKTHNMPFSKADAFEMVIIVNQEGYQVTVNGKDFHKFKHRLPVERVCALHIGGDVSIQTINVIGGGGGMGGGNMAGGYPAGGYPGDQMGGGYPGDMGGGMGGCYPGGPGGYPGGPGGYPGGPGGYPGGPGGYPGGPGGYPEGYPGGNLPTMVGQPIYNPTIPFSGTIPGGLSSKRTIIIRGIVPIGANRFCVNFVVGGSRDIAFHMNPRLREKEVVRNSMIGGVWGAEEKQVTLNPFQEGQYFDISIRCGNQRFKVFVNGQHVCDFAHRYPNHGQIDTLELTGDIQVSYVHF
ncbi:galectin-6 isoform X1 [Esox lucius]|uniref:Galectin n=1 Tax=Esox lucius TaxID=8010 RepID=A0A6Q2XRJ8_ESOLU|nr:galectin-6 isoform X1 [Esox lucius]